eukprot:72137-Pelagomonas_calceolata.AAC.4
MWPNVAFYQPGFDLCCVSSTSPSPVNWPETIRRESPSPLLFAGQRDDGGVYLPSAGSHAAGTIGLQLLPHYVLVQNDRLRAGMHRPMLGVQSEWCTVCSIFPGNHVLVQNDWLRAGMHRPMLGVQSEWCAVCSVFPGNHLLVQNDRLRAGVHKPMLGAV